MAVRQAGGAAAAMLWQFPVASHLAHASCDDLLQAWDGLHAGLRRRADVAATGVGPARLAAGRDRHRRREAGLTDALVVEALREAFKAAADPKMFSEQISAMGLKPWRASKLYGRCDGRTEGPVLLDLTVVSGPLEATPRIRHGGRRLLGDEAAVDSDEAKLSLTGREYARAQDHHELMQGVELAPGGLARRPLAITEASPAVVKAIHQEATLRTLSEAPISGLTDPEKLLSQIGPMLADMPDDMAGRAAYAVGEQYAREGQWNLCAETFLMMVDRYPAIRARPTPSVG